MKGSMRRIDTQLIIVVFMKTSSYT